MPRSTGEWLFITAVVCTASAIARKEGADGADGETGHFVDVGGGENASTATGSPVVPAAHGSEWHLLMTTATGRSATMARSSTRSSMGDDALGSAARMTIEEYK